MRPLFKSFVTISLRMSNLFYSKYYYLFFLFCLLFGTPLPLLLGSLKGGAQLLCFLFVLFVSFASLVAWCKGYLPASLVLRFLLPVFIYRVVDTHGLVNALCLVALAELFRDSFVCHMMPEDEGNNYVELPVDQVGRALRDAIASVDPSSSYSIGAVAGQPVVIIDDYVRPPETGDPTDVMAFQSETSASSTPSVASTTLTVQSPLSPAGQGFHIEPGLVEFASQLAQNNGLLCFQEPSIRASTLVSALTSEIAPEQPLREALGELLGVTRELKEQVEDHPNDQRALESYQLYQWRTRRVLYNTALYLSDNPSALGLSTKRELFDLSKRSTMWSDPGFRKKFDTIASSIYAQPIPVRKSAPV